MLTTQLLLLGVMYMRSKSETRDNEINELHHYVNDSLYIRELLAVSSVYAVLLSVLPPLATVSEP